MHNKPCKFESPADWFHTLATHFVEAQFIFQLNQMGVFNILYLDGEASVEEIAGSLKLRAPLLKTVLDYVARVSEIMEKSPNNKFKLTDFGKSVLEHYKRLSDSDLSFNLFDVRVGAYGNVWSEMRSMVDGTKVYGQDFKRRGQYANKGVYILGAKIAESIQELIGRNKYDSVVELGLNSGSLLSVGRSNQDISTVGVDRKQEALDIYRDLDIQDGETQVELICSDIFEIERWSPALNKMKNGLIYSLHFHEFLAVGEEDLRRFFKDLKGKISNFTLAIIEVPKVPDEEMSTVSHTKWLYSSSDVLIHELIGIGRILTEKQWLGLVQDCGLKLKEIRDTKAFGFRMYLFTV